MRLVVWKPKKPKQQARNKAFFFSMQNKLIVSFAAILLLPSVAIATFSYQTAKDKIDDEIVQSANQSVFLLNNVIDEFFEGKERDIDWLASELDLSAVQSADGTPVGVDEAVREQLIRYNKLHADSEMAFIGTQAGLYMNSAARTTVSEGYDPRTSGWYTEALASNGKPIITAPYESENTGGLIVTVAKATLDGQGVVGINLDVSKIARIAENVTLEEGGYLYYFLIDQNGKYVYHPVFGGGTRVDLPEMISGIAESPSGYFTYVDAGEKRKLVYKTNEKTGWIISGSMLQAEVATQASPILRSTTIVLLVSLALGAIVVFLMIYGFQKPLKRLNEVSLRIAEGDLTEQIAVAKNDEFGRLGNNFNRMAESLRHLVAQVNQSSLQLAASSQQLVASSENIRESGRTVATAMMAVAEGSSEQVRQVNEAGEDVNHMVRQLQLISGNSDEVASSATDSASKAEEGSHAIQTVVAQMRSIEGRVTTLSEDIAALGERSRQIVDFVKVIMEIAEQTNLLSLNASIEAARAGEQGAGFAVVAAEIKKLADQSSASAKQVAALIRTVQQDTQITASSMQLVTSEVKHGRQVADQAGYSFQHILESIAHVASQVDDVSRITQAMSSNSLKVIESMGVVADISQEAAFNTQQIAASSQEQQASMEEIASSSALLKQMADELQQIVGKFKL